MVQNQQVGREQRRWDKARECRPLISEARKSFFTGRQSVGFEEFSVFFRKFLQEAKPATPADTFELHKCLSLACRGEERVPVVFPEKNHGIQLKNFLPAVLAVRDVLLRFGEGEEKATELALETARKWDSERLCRPQCVGAAAAAEDAEIAVNGLATALAPHFQQVQPREKLQSILQEFYAPSSAVGIESTVQREGIFGRLLKDVQDRHAFAPFHHPLFDSQLIAVLGRNAKDSYHYRSGLRNFFESFDGNAILDAGKFGSSYTSVVAMYPWEADHLLIANEMRARGINVAKPAGRLFLGELECAMFQWVKGEPVIRVKDPEALRALGGTVRFCHQQGVLPSAAAVLSAVWDGKKITFRFIPKTVVMDWRAASDEERLLFMGTVESAISWSNLFGKGMRSDAFLDGYRN